MNTVLFKSKIFEINKKSTKTETRANTALLIGILVGIFISLSIIIYVNKNVGIAFGIFFSLLFEKWHQNKYGKFYMVSFVNDLEITCEGITIDDIEFHYESISELKFTNGYFHQQHKKKRNRSSERNNTISFTHNNTEHHYRFIINSLEEFKKFINAYIFIVCEEKIVYNKSNFYNIPNDYRNNLLFKEFVVKLMKEKKIECTEGILIIGYKTYEESKELKAKYCN